jgi:hypothetical protein
LETTFRVSRQDRTVEVVIRWDVRAVYREWSEKHPYGLGKAVEAVGEAQIESVECLAEEWPEGHESEELSSAELRAAQAEALAQAEDQSADVFDCFEEELCCR